MNSLSKLHLTNLFKKYDYLSTELELKNEISNISRITFLDNIQRVINSNDKLKEIYSEPFMAEIMRNSELNNDSEKYNDDAEIKESDELLKKLYRKIVKLTHSDNVKNSYLNSLYVDATRALKSTNHLLMFKICILLDIDFEIPEDLPDMIFEEIENLQKRIKFIDTSYHMRWHESDKEQKMNIMLEYLKKQFKLSEA